MAFSKVVMLGNLTADPETRTTTSGQSVTTFTMAINRNFKASDGSRREETSFIRCTAWGSMGETIAHYLKKGRQLLVCGHLQQRSWEDKETGKRRSAVDVIVDEFSFVNDHSRSNDGGQSNSNYANNNQAQSSPAAQPAPQASDVDEPIDLSDIPF